MSANQGLPRWEAFFVKMGSTWLAVALGSVLALAVVLRFSWDLGPQTFLHAAFFALLCVVVARYRPAFSWQREGLLLLVFAASSASFFFAPERSAARNGLLVLFDALTALWLTGFLPARHRRALLLVPVFAGLWISVILLCFFALHPAQYLYRQAFPIDYFVNFNVVAGYLTLALPLSFLLWSSHERQARGYLHYCVSLMLLFGILLTRSRTAIAVSGIIAAVAAARMSGFVRRLLAAALIAFTAAAVLLSATKQGAILLSFTERLAWAQAALRQFLDQPFIGSGWGSFEYLYPVYRIVPGAGTLYAHNLPLQLLAETGIAGTASFAFLFYSFFKRSHLLPATLAIAAFLMSNCVDYGFYIPALLLTAAACLGTAFPAELKQRSSPLHPAPLALLIVAGTTALSLPLAASVAYQNAFYHAHRGDSAHAVESLKAAARIDPIASAPHARLSEIYLAEYTGSRNPRALTRAVEEQQKALERFQQNARGWNDLAWLYRLQGRTEEARRAMDRAVKYDPLNGRYTVLLKALTPRESGS